MKTSGSGQLLMLKYILLMLMLMLMLMNIWCTGSSGQLLMLIDILLMLNTDADAYADSDANVDADEHMVDRWLWATAAGRRLSLLPQLKKNQLPRHSQDLRYVRIIVNHGGSLQ